MNELWMDCEAILNIMKVLELKVLFFIKELGHIVIFMKNE